MGGAMKYFLKKLLGNEKFVKPSAATHPPPPSSAPIIVLSQMKVSLFLLVFEKGCCKYKLISNRINDMYYNWIDLRKGADLSKSKGSKKCIVSHY